MRYVLSVVLIVLALQHAPAQSPSTKDDPPPSKTEKVTHIAGKTLDEWIKKLNVEDPSIRSEAVTAIMQFGPDDPKDRPKPRFPKKEVRPHVLGYLLNRLKIEADQGVKSRILLALRVMDVPDNYVQLVIKGVAERCGFRELQAIVRYEALKTLSRFHADIPISVKVSAKDGYDAFPALEHAATKTSSSWETRKLALALLWRVGVNHLKDGAGPDPRIVKTMIVAMKQRYNGYQVRLEAVMGLAHLGKPADAAVRESAVKELQLYAKGPRADLRDEYTTALQIWGCAALTHMGEPTGLNKATWDRLIDFTKPSHKTETRVQAIAALGTARKEDVVKHLPKLLALLNEKEDLAILSAACGALSNLKNDSEALVDKLLALVQPENLPEKPKPSKDELKVAAQKQARTILAIQTLVAMEKRRGRVYDALEKLKKDEKASKGLQFFADQALKQLKEKEKPAVKEGPKKEAPKIVAPKGKPRRGTR